MKIAEILFYLVTLTGFMLKPLHLPGHTIIILLGLLLLFIFYLYALVTSARSLPYIFTGMAAVFIMASLLCHLKFFFFSSYVMDFSAFILLIAIMYSIKKKMYFKFLSSFVLLLVATHATMLTQPRHAIYYFVNIKFNRHIEHDYITWDKYSWFLYIDKKYAEAADANKKAAQIAAKTSDTEFQLKIKAHGKQIDEKKWSSFQK